MVAVTRVSGIEAPEKQLTWRLYITIIIKITPKPVRHKQRENRTDRK